MKIFFLIVLMYATAAAQWGAGGGFQVKSSEATKGAAAYLVQKLPYQFPFAGFSLKGKLGYFFSRKEVVINSVNTEEKFREITLDLFLQSDFYYDILEPYAAIGLGGGNLKGDGNNRLFLSASILAGVKFFYQIQPFIEVQLLYSFSNLNIFRTVDISRNQIIGVIGLLFQI